MRIRKLSAYLLVTALCESHAARAQAPAPDASVAPSSPPLGLALSLGDSKLRAEAIVRAIELELKRPVAWSNADPSAEGAIGAAQTLSVVVHADHTVSVSYHAADGVTRTRSIGLPQDDARGAEVIALLAGNLSRDEAAELLAGLAAHAKGPTEASTPPATQPGTEPAKSEPVPSPPPAAKPAEPTRPVPPKPNSAAVLLTKPYPLFNLSLAHPISLVPDSERYVVNGELGLVYSRVGELRGAGLDVMVLSTERDVHGFSYATFYNRTGGSTYGVTTAALVSRYADLQGCALSGILNWGRDARGCVVAGIANRGRDGRGIQAAGIANIARKFAGVQLSGISNIADEIAGAQIGVVNVAGNVSGLQLGVVNVAKHVDGTSLGVVSIAGNGRAQAVLWASTFMPVNLAAKFTVGWFYSQVGGGYVPGNQTYVYELGLGAHIPIGRFFLEPGVHYSEQRGTTQALRHELSENLHYRVSAGFDLHSVSPFVGAAVRQRFAHAVDAPDSAAAAVEGFFGVAFF